MQTETSLKRSKRFCDVKTPHPRVIFGRYEHADMGEPMCLKLNSLQVQYGLIDVRDAFSYHQGLIKPTLNLRTLITLAAKLLTTPCRPSSCPVVTDVTSLQTRLWQKLRSLQGCKHQHIVDRGREQLGLASRVGNTEHGNAEVRLGCAWGVGASMSCRSQLVSGENCDVSSCLVCNAGFEEGVGKDSPLFCWRRSLATFVAAIDGI